MALFNRESGRQFAEHGTTTHAANGIDDRQRSVEEMKGIANERIAYRRDNVSA